MLFSSSKIDAYALKKDNYISISLEVSAVQTKISKKAVVTPKEKIQSISEAKEVDIGDLFSDVWTKDIKIEKQEKKVDNKRLDLILKKIKTKDKNNVKSISETVLMKTKKVQLEMKLMNILLKFKQLYISTFIHQKTLKGILLKQ